MKWSENKEYYPGNDFTAGSTRNHYKEQFDHYCKRMKEQVVDFALPDRASY